MPGSHFVNQYNLQADLINNAVINPSKYAPALLSM